MWTVNFQMFKLVLEKTEEPEIKLPTSAGSWKKQENSRKTSISALLTRPKPLTVWITINCGKFWKRWEYQTTWPASWEILCSSVQSSLSVVSNSLQPHEPRYARPPCPSPTPRVHPNPCSSSRWCHPTISSSIIPVSSCPQSFPASGSFPMSQLFTSSGQSIGISVSTSVLPMNSSGWWWLISSVLLTRTSCHKTAHANGYYGAWPRWVVSVSMLPLTLPF